MNRQDRIQVLEEKKKNKRKALIIVLGVLTILVALMGASFAYIRKHVDYIGNNESMQMSTVDIEGVTFQASDSIRLENAVPGDSQDMDFTISNPNKNAKVRYTIKLVADKNDFNIMDGVGQLIVTLSGENMEEPAVVDFTDGENMQNAILLSRVELAPRESDVYNLKLDFVELDTNQNFNQQKTFAGHIEVTQTIVVNSQN